MPYPRDVLKGCKRFPRERLKSLLHRYYKRHSKAVIELQGLSAPYPGRSVLAHVTVGKLGHLLRHLPEDDNGGVIRIFLREGQVLIIRQGKVAALIRHGFFDFQTDDLFSLGLGQPFQPSGPIQYDIHTGGLNAFVLQIFPNGFGQREGA